MKISRKHESNTKYWASFSLLALVLLLVGIYPTTQVHAGKAGSGTFFQSTPTPGGLPEFYQEEGPPQRSDYLAYRDIRFEHISVEQNLSQSSVQSILQDARGFMWFGTEDGLNKYDGYTFNVYKPIPGDPASISQQSIRSIIEDHQGLLWIATDSAGLNRFDRDTGKFIVFRHNEADEFSLSSDFVNVVYEDLENVIWVGTREGLNRFDREQGRFIHYRSIPGEPDSLSNDQVSTIYEDRQGILWVGTTGGGLNKFDRETGRFSHYRYDSSDANSLSNDNVECIYEDRYGTLWIGTWGGGLNHFNRLSESFVSYRRDPANPYSLSNDQVAAIYEDTLGDLWIGTYGDGLNKFDRAQERFYRYYFIQDDQYSLSNNFVLSIYEDRTGVLWIGTQGGGLNKLERLAPRFTHVKAEADETFSNINALNNEVVLSLFEDHEGMLWIGTNGGGLNMWDRKNGQWFHYQNDPTDPNSLSMDIVKAIIEDKQGWLWIGTDGGGLDRFDRNSGRFYHHRHDEQDPSSVNEDAIECLYLDREGVLWIGTKNNGLDRYDAVKRRFIHNIPVEGDPNTLSSPYIRVIYEDRNEDLWIGTRNGGLNVLERESQRFTHYHSDPADPYSLSNHYIISIYEDRSGTLWLGSFGGGLNKFNRQDSTFTHYRMQDGLPSDIVYGILEDKNGMLWLSTNNGLSKFDPASDTFVNFDVDDGLQSTEFSNGAYLKSRSGEMFFGGIHGFNLFDPEFIGEGNPFKPSVVLTSITQDGIAPELDKALENLKELTLRWPKNSFEFEFTALSYIHPEKNQYAYKLDEYDPEWIYIGRKRSGRYVNLPGGTYTLRMKASNNDGAWNEDGASLRIVVVPPIWYDWKFLGGVLLALAIGASLIYRMRARGIEVRSRELARQVEERTQELLETNQILEKEITERKRVEDQLAQQAAKSAVAAERSRLARELHDAVTQTLFSASLIAEALPASWENNAREGRELLDELRQLSKGALAEMRTLLLELRPSALAEANMAELLRQLAEAVSGREGIPVSVIVNGDCQLPHDVHIALYRIAQEALNNVVKHAHASAVEVRLDSTVDSNKTNHCHIDNESCLCVELCIKDNGFGFDPQKTPTNHLGLAIMRERARAVGAELSIESQPGYGTCIRVGWSGIGRKE